MLPHLERQASQKHFFLLPCAGIGSQIPEQVSWEMKGVHRSVSCASVLFPFWVFPSCVYSKCPMSIYAVVYVVFTVWAG